MHNKNCCLARGTSKLSKIQLKKLMSLMPQSKSRAAAEKLYKWKTGKEIYIKFLGGTPQQRNQVKRYAAEWMKYANLKFVYVADHSPYSDVRIAFDQMDGAWSYIGIVAQVINQEAPTMNLGWIDNATVLHEFGHMLGLIHEHQNPKGAIRWNWQALRADLSVAPNFWSDDEIRSNITDHYLPENIEGTEVDRKSIMMYPIPRRWTLDGFTAADNKTLSDWDKSFIGFIYPFDSPEPITPIEPDTTEVAPNPTEPSITEEEPTVTEEETEEVPTITLEEIYAEGFVKMFPTYRHIKKMFEFSVVEMAKLLGIDAKVSDREIDTVKKIHRKLYPNKSIGHIE